MRIALVALLCIVSKVGLAGGIQIGDNHYDDDQERNLYTFTTQGDGEGLKYDIELNMAMDSRYRDERYIKSNADKTVVCIMECAAHNAYNITLIECLEDGKLVVFPDFNKEVIRLLNDNHIKFENGEDSFYLKAVEDSKGGTILDIRSPDAGRYYRALNVKFLVHKDGKITIESIERPQ